jgi:NIMA-interacting peptidyl-prolyl cis-trans isomerase 1
VRLLSLAYVALFASSCVVTTIEGPGEPPRAAPPPGAPEGRAPQDWEHGESVAPARQEPREISVRHLLVSYRGALRAPKDVTRTKEQALARAQEAAGRAKAGEDFAALVAEYSDEPGAAERGGDLGRVSRGMMVKPFENAAFKLAPNQVSDVVETDFGFHVIERTE